MPDFLPIIEKISSKLAKPYLSCSSAFFVVEKENCYLQLHFNEDSILVQGFVGGAGLCLNSMDLYDFMFRVRQLSSTYPVVLICKLELEIYKELSHELYYIFPRISYWQSYKGVEDSLVETHKALLEIGRIVDEFRAKDKNFESLQHLWNKATSSSDSKEKGKLLEEVFALLVSRDENFAIIERNLRTGSEELDIVVENKGATQFYSQLKCPVILFECRNWSSKIGSKEIRDFAQKIQNRSRLLCAVGILATTSEFTRDAYTELLGYRGKDFMVGTLERKDIETILQKRISLGTYLKDTIRKAGLR